MKVSIASPLHTTEGEHQLIFLTSIHPLHTTDHQIKAPEGYQLLPGDLADPSSCDDHCGSGDLLVPEEGQAAEGETGRQFEEGTGELANPVDEKKGERGRETVFLCVKARSGTDVPFVDYSTKV